MAIEKIDDVFDIPAIAGQVKSFLELLGTADTSIVTLYKHIESYKGSAVTDLANDTKDLSKAMTDANKVSEKVVQTNRQIVESAKAQSTAILGGSDSYAFYANTVQEVIRQQLKLKTQLEINKDKIKENENAWKSGKKSADDYRDSQIDLEEAQRRMKLEIQDLNKSINMQIKANSSVGGSLDDLKNQYNQLYDVFRKLTNEERNSDMGQQLASDLGNLKSNINEVQKQAGDFSANVGRYAGSFKEAFSVLEKELIGVRNQLAGMNPNSAGFAELAKQEAQLTKLTDGLNKEFGSQTQELKALQNAAITLGTTLGNENITFTSFKDAVGEAKDSIEDIRGQIKLAASDTRTLDGLIGVAEGLAGAYGVAQGAAALFGNENEELQKTFVKLQAVMTILQGLQAVRNALQTESAAMDAIMTVRTKALTIAQAAYTFVVGASTGAMKAFRIALASTGVGLLVIALGYLVAKMTDVGESTDEATKAMQDQQDAADNLVESLDKVANAAEKVRNANAGGVDSLRRELELMKAKGATAEEIFNKEQSIRQAEMSNLKIQALTYQGTYERRKKLGQLTEADAQKLSDKITEINKVGQDKANEIEAAKLSFQKDLSEKATKAAEEAGKKRIDYLSKEAKAAYEITRMRLQQESGIASEVANNDAKGYAERIQAVLRFEDIQHQLIIGERDFILKSENLTKTEREKVKVDAELKLNELARGGIKTRQDIIENEKEAEKALFDEMNAAITPDPAALEARAALITKNVQDIFNKIDFSNSNQYEADLKGLYDSLKQKKITLEEYEVEKLKIQTRYGKMELGNAVAQSEALISNLKAQGVDTTELEKELNAQKQALRDADVESAEKAEADKLKAAEEAQAKLSQNLQNFQTMSSNLLSAYGEIASIGIDRQKVATDELEVSQQKNYENELKRINSSAATDEEKANQLKILEAERTAQKIANDRKLKQLEAQRAKIQKAQDIASIISGTAVAVVSALGSKPFTPANIAIAAGVGLLGAAQLARAIAAPIPEYAEGTENHPGGLAIVGERGSELIKERGKAPYMSPGVPTLVSLSKGAKVIPADEINEHLHNAMMRETGRRIVMMEKKKEDGKLGRIEDAILAGTHATIKEMRKQKRTTNINNNIDLGWSSYVQKKSFN